MDQLQEIYRGQRAPTQISSEIIGRSFMCYTGIWLDKNKYPKRMWYWTVGHLIGFFALSFTVVTFSWGFTNNLETISDFGGLLIITIGAMVALFKALFLTFNREIITDILDSVVLLDSRNRQKAEEDAEIRKLRSSYYVKECVLIISAVAFTFLMDVLIFGPTLVSSGVVLPLPAAKLLALYEMVIGFWPSFVIITFGSTWGGLAIVSTDFLIGNLYNQIILNFNITIRELERIGQDSRAINGKEKREEDDRKRKEVIIIIQDYQLLRELLHTMNRAFNKILLVQVMSNMVLVTVLSIELAFVIHEGLVYVIPPAMFIVFINIPFFYWCWLGQRMLDLTDDIPFAVYGFDWNCGDLQFRKLRLMLMQMTDQPLKIHAFPFFIFDHSLFMTVLRRAYSIMAVLKDVASANK